MIKNEKKRVPFSLIWSFLKNKKLRRLLSFGVGIFLLLLVYKNMDLEKILQLFSQGGVNWWIIAGTLVLQWVANGVRALRWQLLIDPLVDNPPSKRVVMLSVFGCYAVNMLFPRAGEVWRCGVLSKREGISMSKLIGTMVVDRITDVLVVFLLGCLGLVCFFQFIFDFIKSQDHLIDNLIHKFLAPKTLIVLGLLLLLLLFLYFFLRKKKHSNLGKELNKLKEGLFSLKTLQYKWRFVVYTLLMWGLYFFSFYLTFYAFDFTVNLGIVVGLLAFLMGSCAGIVPVQGAIGTWHFMIITTLVSFSIDKEMAGAFAFVVHTTHVFGIALIGLFAILLLSLLHRDKKEKIE